MMKTYNQLSQAFHNSHHQQESQIVHNMTIWVHNETNESCTQNPCGVCQEMIQQGLQFSEPTMEYNLQLQQESWCPCCNL